MKRDNQAQFTLLMDKFDRMIEKDRLDREREKDETEKFWHKFQKVRAEIIRPVMKDIGNLLRERGHGYRISEDESLFDRDGQAQEEKITMSIIPAGTESDNSSRISLTATAHRKIRLYHDIVCIATESRESGTIAEFWVDEITNDLIEDKIIYILTKIFEPREDTDNA